MPASAGSRRRRKEGPARYQTCSAGSLGGNEGCPAAQERIVDRLPGAAVIEDGPAHAFDGLLRAVLSFGILAAARNRPQRRLLTIARSNSPSFGQRTNMVRAAIDNHPGR
jgi:hypothetical protein